MRYLELTVMILTVILSLWLLLFKNKGKPFIFPVVMNTVLLAAHLIVEKPRWQMGIIYFFALILLEYVLWANIHGKEIRINKVLKGFLTVIAVLLVVLSVIPPLALPVPRLPEPTGSFPIGSMSFLMEDTSRSEIYTEEEGDFRELMITVWYPAQKEKGAKPAPYVVDTQALGAAIRDGVGVHGFLVGYLSLVKSGVVADAPLSDDSETYPLLVFSHGLGVSSGFYASIIVELVSRGYIVASIDHTYSTISTTFSDGRVTNFQTDVENYSDAELAELEAIWSEDIRFVVTQMEAMNQGVYTDAFRNRIDTARIGALGHSFGGGAAYTALFADERIKAAINLDGSVYGVDPSLSFESKSFMLLTSDDYAAAIRDAESKLISYDELSEEKRKVLEEEGVDRIEYDEQMGRMVDCMDFLKNVLAEGNLFLRISGTKHYNFSDLAIFSPLVKSMGMTGSIDERRGLSIVTGLCGEFFDERLTENAGPRLSEFIRDRSEIVAEALR
ncbi:MAG: alpha/beta fold hydrolase [Clostridiales bacterium]|nr:alpha/beta fold hydrolase [Clostridiales bacterium]